MSDGLDSSGDIGQRSGGCGLTTGSDLAVEVPEIDLRRERLSPLPLHILGELQLDGLQNPDVLLTGNTQRKSLFHELISLPRGTLLSGHIR